MDRALYTTLIEWKHNSRRKPIILKGARQVGKSFLVRQLGKTFDHFVEVNFDFQKELKRVFKPDLDPARIVRELRIALRTKMPQGQTLLFLDEIQECPEAIGSLRYFYEQMPGLHVIAAGSLIDFALEHTGLPVGRVTPLHLYPLSFMEFLEASSEQQLRDALYDHDPGEVMADVLHNRLNRLLSEFMAVGGMPEAVDTWLATRDLATVTEIQRALVETYRQDFSKYATTKRVKYVDLMFSGLPTHLGQKIVFARFGSEFRSRELKPALELLSKAQVVHKVHHSSCGSAPLVGQCNPDFFKVVLCDVGLAQAMLSLDAGRWILDGDNHLVAGGPIVEGFVGQEIIAYSPASERARLFYWAREKRGASAKLDYIVEPSGMVIPVEVKAGHSNHIRSLKIFLKEKPHVKSAVVFSRGNFERDGNVQYFPLYAIALAMKQM